MSSRHRLSGVPPAEFTQARDSLVKELRAAGAQEEAKRTAALRKPSVALWVTNQLAKEARQKVDALVDAAQKLKRAHASSDTAGSAAPPGGERQRPGRRARAARAAAPQARRGPAAELA